MTAAPGRQARLWAVVGATGTGKTALSLDLAEALADRGVPAEIVNADAMQLYRGMDIGTAKVSVPERRGIPHHLLDLLDVADDAAVAWYQRVARDEITRIGNRGADTILVGGSGLYVSAVLFDFRFPPHDNVVRAELERELETSGPGLLHDRLRDLDPDTAARIDPRNGRRIVRALEILAQGERTHGAALPSEPEFWHPRTTIIGVQVAREVLVPRLERRVQQMWADGIVAEAVQLREQGLDDAVTARRAIGYAQALGQHDGQLSRDEAIAAAQALTRRYARRQVAWFRRYPGIRWVEPDVDVAALVSASVG